MRETLLFSIGGPLHATLALDSHCCPNGKNTSIVETLENGEPGHSYHATRDMSGATAQQSSTCGMIL
jgi:hypothetical protein